MGVLKISSKFTGEHPCWSVISLKLLQQLYLNHTSAWVFSCKFAVYLLNLLHKETLIQVFSYEFYEIIKSSFFTEQPWATASKLSTKLWICCISYISIIHQLRILQIILAETKYYFLESDLQITKKEISYSNSRSLAKKYI